MCSVCMYIKCFYVFVCIKYVVCMYGVYICNTYHDACACIIIDWVPFLHGMQGPRGPDRTKDV